MRNSSRIAVIIAMLGLASSARADFTPPKDGKLTDKQVTTAIDILKEQMDSLRSAGKATQGNQSSAANLAIMMRASEKMDAAAVKHGMSKEEYDWVNSQLSKIWPAAMMIEQWEDSAKPDLERQIKTKQAEREANVARQAAYEQAQKDGRRILTKDQRDAAIKSSTTDRDAIIQEEKGRESDLKAAKDDLALHQKEEKEAEGLARNPPADVSADDRAGYVDGKKGEAQTARDAQKDSIAAMADAQKALDEVNSRLAAVDAKLKNPDLPMTEDEKAQVKQENQQNIEDAKKAVDDDDQTIAGLKDTLAAGAPKFDEGNEPIDPDNMALVKKHIKEYLTAIGASDMLKK